MAPMWTRIAGATEFTQPRDCAIGSSDMDKPGASMLKLCTQGRCIWEMCFQASNQTDILWAQPCIMYWNHTHASESGVFLSYGIHLFAISASQELQDMESKVREICKFEAFLFHPHPFEYIEYPKPGAFIHKR